MDDDQERELEALEGILCDPSAEPIKLSYGLLKSITDNFSSEIGRGGFGVVYQGDLRNGVVAVKRSNGLYITDKQFLDEIKCLKSANHKNIVRFLGYCADTQEHVMPLDGTFVMAGERNRLFCFEYVPNGNIRQYLEQEKSHGDDWPTRYQMIRGICQGLKYLHDKQINHLDLKPENVMLDAHMEAKITDFGLSRFLDQGKSRIITKHICGTLRYIAPEVIDKSELSFKSDIYALGVLIIELLTGTSMISLGNWDESLDLLDCPRARMCIEIARNCTDAKRDNRPTIHEVIHCMGELESMIPKFSITNQMHAGLDALNCYFMQLLDVYPLELRFLFQPYQKGTRCRLTMTNKTDSYVYYMLFPIHAEDRYCMDALLPPVSSSVARVDVDDVGAELPSDMVEWEILMFTAALHDDIEVIRDWISLAFKKEEELTYDDQIKLLQGFFGGEMHRAALTASIIVDSDEQLEMHTLGQEFFVGELYRGAFTASVVVDTDEWLEMDTIYYENEDIAINWMDVHPTEPWVLLIAGIRVYIWNCQTKEKVGEYKSPAGQGQRQRNKETRDGHHSVAKFIAREKWVVTGNYDGVITVLTCPTLEIVNRFEARGDGVSLLAVHPTSPFLLSFGLPLSLKLWDWRSDWSCTRIFDVKARLWQILFNPKDPTTFATRGQDGLVQMWKIGHLNSVARTHSRDGRERSHLFTYTGNRDCIASIVEDSHNISIWDLRKEKHVYTLRSEDYSYVLAVCHPTHPILVTVSRNLRIEVWNSTTYRLKKAYNNLPKVPIHVGFTGSGRLVIGYKRGISVLDIDLE